MSTAADKKPSKKPYDRPPNSKGKDKVDEDAGKVRRPQNSWILYRKEKFELLRKEAEAENKPRPIAAEASKIISEAWKKESPEARKYYNDLAEKEKARHAEEHPNYKFKPKTKAQKLQEREAKDFAKKRKGDDLRNEREAKLVARSTRGVGSDRMHPPMIFYPPFPMGMGPPPVPPRQLPSATVPPMPWFPFPYPAYLPTPNFPPPVPKTLEASAPTASESESASAHQASGEAKAAKVMVKEKKRRSMESNSPAPSQSASSAGVPAPANPRATAASSPPIQTPPTVQQELRAPMRKSSPSSSHSATEATPPSQLPRHSIRSKPKPQTPSPAPTPSLSFDLNLLGRPFEGPSTQPLTSSGQSSPIRPASDPPNLFVNPMALSLAPSPALESAPLQAPLFRPSPEPSPTQSWPGADPILEPVFTSRNIISSYPSDTLDLPFPATQEAFDLAGFDELNFTSGAGQFDLDEMFDWENVLGDGELGKWGGGWEGIDNTCMDGLDLGNGEFELDDGDDGLGLGFDDVGINLAVGLGVGVDTAGDVTARVGVPAVLPTPSRLVTGRSTIAGSSSGSSGPVGSNENGSGPDGLFFPDLSAFPTSSYANYPRQLQMLQSQTEVPSLWDIPISDSPVSICDYVDYTMCRTPSAAGPSRGASLGPSRPLSRAANVSASGTGRGRSLSRSCVPSGTTPSRDRSVASTRGRSLTRSTAGGSSRARSQISRADSHESVGRRMKHIRIDCSAAGPTISQGPSGELGMGLDLTEMRVDLPPTLPPPSAITGVGLESGTDIGMGAVSFAPPLEVTEGMDAQVRVAFGGGSSARHPTYVQPDFVEPSIAPAKPLSMAPSRTLQPQLKHIQGVPPPDIPTVSSEDLAGIAGQGAIAWDPAQPPPAGYLLVAVPIPNSISPAATSSNFMTLSARGQSFSMAQYQE